MDLVPPAIVYLDYNVVVYLLDGKLPDLRRRLDELREAERAVIPFTREHVVEAMRGIDDDTEQALRDRAAFVLAGISSLTDNVHFHEDMQTGRLTVTRWSPMEVFEETCQPSGSEFEPIGDPEFDAALAVAERVVRQRLRLAYAMHAYILDQFEAGRVEVADLRERLAALQRKQPPVQQASDELMRILLDASARSVQHLDVHGLNPGELNNVSVGELPMAIGERLQRAGSPHDLEGVVAWIRQSTDKLGDHPIATHLGLPGTFGYNRDKASTTAASRISDLGHANLGLRADVFITDDRRLRNRAIATAHELGLRVRVASLDDALPAIEEVVGTTGRARGC